MAVDPEGLTTWSVAGSLLIVMCTAEIAGAVQIAARDQTGAVWIAVIVSATPLLLWMTSQATGMPIAATQVGSAGGTVAALGVITLSAALALLFRGGRWLRGLSISQHLSGLAVLSVVAVAATGLLGAVTDPGPAGPRSHTSTAHSSAHG
jgi:hypothetical protein